MLILYSIQLFRYHAEFRSSACDLSLFEDTLVVLFQLQFGPTLHEASIFLSGHMQDVLRSFQFVLILEVPAYLSALRYQTVVSHSILFRLPLELLCSLQSELIQGVPFLFQSVLA